MDDLQVFDFRDQNQINRTPSPFNESFANDWQKLHDMWGIVVDRSQGRDAAQPGQRYWHLKAVYVDWSGSQYIVRVLDENEQPLSNIAVINWWPGVDKYNRNEHENIHPFYGVTDFFDHGTTNANGDHGVAFSSGSVMKTIGQPGPDRIWVNSDPPSAPDAVRGSDGLIGLQWLGGTNYVKINGIFQAVRKSGSTPDPDDPGGGVIVGESFNVKFLINDQVKYEQDFEFDVNVSIKPKGA